MMQMIKILKQKEVGVAKEELHRDAREHLLRVVLRAHT